MFLIRYFIGIAGVYNIERRECEMGGCIRQMIVARHGMALHEEMRDGILIKDSKSHSKLDLYTFIESRNHVQLSLNALYMYQAAHPVTLLTP